MTQYYTDQDRIDAQTMRIDNPNIVGSGYIQFPPQRPFEKPMQMQPPTVAHLEYPQEFQQYAGTGQPAPQPSQPAAAPIVQQPQANGSVRGPAMPQNTYSNPSQPRPAAQQRQGQAPASRQGYTAGSTQSNAGSAQAPPTSYASQQSGAYRAQQLRQAAPAASQQPPHYASAAPQRPAHAPSAQSSLSAPANTYQTPLPQARAVHAPAAAAAAPQPTAALTAVAPAPAAAPAPSSRADDDDKATAGLSKAQKQRLRKKMREGKA